MRTAYPRFKRLLSARELHVFFTPQPDEVAWARRAAGSDEHLLAMVVSLKCFSRLGHFPSLDEVPAPVVEHVRRDLELPENRSTPNWPPADGGHGPGYDSGRARRAVPGAAIGGEGAGTVFPG